MSKFVPIAEIKEMSEAEKDWLVRRCGIREGYYDPDEDVFFINKKSG